MSKRAIKFAWHGRIQEGWFKYRCMESAQLYINKFKEK